MTNLTTLSVLLGAIAVTALLVQALRMVGFRPLGLFNTRTTADKVDVDYPLIATQHTGDGIVITDLNGIVRWTNPAYCKTSGFTLDEIRGQNILTFALPEEFTPNDEQIAKFRIDQSTLINKQFGHFVNIRKDGTRFWNQVSTSILTANDGEELAVMVCRDVTSNIEKERKLAATSQKLAHIAAHDSLTGAANRAELARFLKNALPQTHRAGGRLGLLHIDLDKFKQINDAHGHSAGDAVLVAASKRMRSVLRDSDLLARVGGDEFVIVCHGVNDLSDLKRVADKVLRAVNHPLRWKNKVLQCQISIGAAISDPDSDNADDLLLQSDFALYEVKQTGRGLVSTYNHELHTRYTRENRLAAELRQAINNKSLSFFFQPVVSNQNDAVVGVETLVRWNHPTDGWLAPSEFLPLAEAMGLIADIDFLAMEAAMDIKVKLNERGHAHILAGFNTSPAVLLHPCFRTRLRDGVRKRGLSADQFVIEVLENVIFEDGDGAATYLQVVNELTKEGFKTYLDDFGSGYAGLIHLPKLALTGIKLDRSLCKDMARDKGAREVIKAVTALCENLELMIVAEGIENLEQFDIMSQVQRCGVQGFYICHPLPEDDLLPWIDARLCPIAAANQTRTA